MKVANVSFRWLSLAAIAVVTPVAFAQEYAGPLLPHVGGQVTTAFSNRFGPDAAYNQKLSAARAASVAAAIAGQGIAANRIQTGGFGATQPKGDNATLDGRALNRRVELLRTDR